MERAHPAPPGTDQIPAATRLYAACPTGGFGKPETPPVARNPASLACRRRRRMGPGRLAAQGIVDRMAESAVLLHANNANRRITARQGHFAVLSLRFNKGRVLREEAIFLATICIFMLITYRAHARFLPSWLLRGVF
jgi:hypothetical protein